MLLKDWVVPQGAHGGAMRDEFDVIVVGAGVIGAATARELSRFDVRVLVLEAGLDLACGATRANSGIVHAGYDSLPGTLKARYNVAGSALFDQWQRELGFGFYRNGALVVALDEGERATLEQLLARAGANGVKDACIVEAEELRAMEPNVSTDAIAALSVPSSGICDPYGLTYGAAENAAANGVEFLFDARVVGLARKGGVFSARIQDGREFRARSIVNCAGVHADDVNNMLSAHTIEIAPVKGEYLLFHNRLAGTFGRTVFGVPGAAGKGVLVSPVIFGNIFIGPNAGPASSKEDLATTASGQAEVLKHARRMWQGVSTDQVIATYAGLRATDGHGRGDFVVGEAPDVPGLFNAACIDSPGLASAPAIATDLACMVAERLGAGLNPGFNPVRVPAPLLAMMDDEDKARLIAKNSLYGVPVCRCCHVSEGELADALNRALPVMSLDALKWRTGATMGPCHGGRCTARILQIAARELGTEVPAMQKRSQGSSFFCECKDLLPDAVVSRALALANEMRVWLERKGRIEIGSGSVGIAGTRPSGVYSALETLELMVLTHQVPGRCAVVWGSHDFALRMALVLDEAGVEVERVVESGDAPAGASGFADALEERGIALCTGARVTRVDGVGRLASVLVEKEGMADCLVECDLLVVSPALVVE